MSSVSTPAQDVADRWPLGCHSPNSCSSHGRCMYVGCKHDGKDIAALATAFTPDPRRTPASVATPAQGATALADEFDAYHRNNPTFGANQHLFARISVALRATSQTSDAVVWMPIETAPKNRSVGHVRLFGDGEGIHLCEYIGIWSPGEEAWREVYSNRRVWPTHWMPCRTPSASASPQKKPWIEGEPEECDGSAWDRLPPVVRAEDRLIDDERIDFLITYLGVAGGGFADNCILKPELLSALSELRRERDKPSHCPGCDGDHL